MSHHHTVSFYEERPFEEPSALVISLIEDFEQAHVVEFRYDGNQPSLKFSTENKLNDDELRAVADLIRDGFADPLNCNFAIFSGSKIVYDNRHTLS